MAKRTLPADVAGTPSEMPHKIDRSTAAQDVADPVDYSAVGGPDSEPAYGRTRAANGEYPFNAHGGAYDRDEPAPGERGGIQTKHHIEKRT